MHEIIIVKENSFLILSFKPFNVKISRWAVHAVHILLSEYVFQSCIAFTLIPVPVAINTTRVVQKVNTICP
jgi:hypothetical protein